MIRKASYDDMEILVKLAKTFHYSSRLKNFRFSPQGTRRYLSSLFECPNSIIYMTDHGAIGGSISHAPFCEALIAKESFWYTDHNNAANHPLSGVKLLKKYMQWLERKGVDVDIMTTMDLDTVDIKSVDVLLARKGYDIFEHSHIRML